METIKITITQQDVDEFNENYFKEHPKATKPLIKAPQHPSLNKTMIANNMQSNRQKQSWKDFILFVLHKRHLLEKRIDVCEIDYITYFKDKRVHDADNITPKFILDGLVAGGFLVADDIDHIRRLTIIGERDKINPRIELIFTIRKQEEE